MGNEPVAFHRTHAENTHPLPYCSGNCGASVSPRAARAATPDTVAMGSFALAVAALVSAELMESLEGSPGGSLPPDYSAHDSSRCHSWLDGPPQEQHDDTQPQCYGGWTHRLTCSHRTAKRLGVNPPFHLISQDAPSCPCSSVPIPKKLIDAVRSGVQAYSAANAYVDARATATIHDEVIDCEAIHDAAHAAPAVAEATA
eukprot:GHVT01070958.1.p1 GENE.GHVT01070958.1~~GHVT01070958.1.p1  ORF type:complete len:200 (-),score=36.85 GHVT01070958.1:546-1145(-)